MPESFSASARRLRADADALNVAGRPQTAGHLVGLSAECVVKAVLERAGIAIDGGTGYRTHFPDLGHRLRVLGRTRHMYPLLLVVAASDFLEDWEVDGRYDGDHPAADAQAAYDRWAEQVDRLRFSAGVMG